MDEEQELSFKSMIDAEALAALNSSTPSTPSAPVAPAPAAAPQITEPTTAQEAVGGTATDGSAANTTPTAPVVPETPEQRQIRLQDVFARRGWQLPEGIDEESLYETTADRIQQAVELQAQLNLRQRELEELKARLASTPAVTPAQPTPAPAPVQQAQEQPKPSRFGLLKEPHSATREYVVKNPSTGAWAVKPEYAGSPTAFAAAEEWNNFERQQAERANMLIQNPKAPWEEEIKPEIEQLVEQRARSILEEHFKKQAEESRARAEQEAQARQDEEARLAMIQFDQQHAKEFYQLDANGRPLMLFGTDQPVVTPFYQQFVAQYERMATEYPMLPQTKIAQLAYDFTKLHAPQASAPAQPALTPEQIAAQTAEKKARFTDHRSEPVKAPGNMQPASITDMSAPPGNKFKDYILQDQENAGNPVWESMRSR